MLRLKELYIIESKDALRGVPEGKVLINTINAHSYNTAQKDDAFAEALSNGDYLIPDGASIIKACHWLKAKCQPKKRIAGWDLFVFEMQRLEGRGKTDDGRRLRVMFLGSSEKVLSLIRERAAIDYPNLEIVTYSPPYKPVFSDEDNQAMIQAINDANPDLLWIGMTAPKQEKWTYRHWNELNIHCHCGTIGAVFDFYAGTAKRAPLWWQEHSQEWLYRLLKEPKRMWRRYVIGNPLFLWNVMKEKLRITFLLAGFLSSLTCYGQAVAQQDAAPVRQLELFCGATLGYADTNWLRLYDVQINATPGLRWHLGHDWSIAAQGLIPVVSDGYTYRDVTYKYWRFNMATVSHQLHFNSVNQHLRLTAGLFGNERYGIDVRWAWPVNSWLLLNAQAGLTASWIMGVDFKGHDDTSFNGDYKVTGMVGADVYLQPQNIEFRLSSGRYVGGDYGLQLDVMRHFNHITLLAFAQLRMGELENNSFDKKQYRTNGGFRIIWMLPPYKKSSRKVVVRPASNFVLSHSSRAGGQSMQNYRIDPEENSRERLIDVNWGLRKEVTR